MEPKRLEWVILGLEPSWPPGWSERFTAGTLNAAPRVALDTRAHLHYVQLSAEETVCL